MICFFNLTTLQGRNNKTLYTYINFLTINDQKQKNAVFNIKILYL